MKNVRMHYDIIDGWILDVEFTLNPIEVEKIIDYTLFKQSDRLKSMISGARRDECKIALDLLRVGRSNVVKQNFIGYNEKELYLNEKRRIK